MTIRERLEADLAEIVGLEEQINGHGDALQALQNERIDLLRQITVLMQESTELRDRIAGMEYAIADRQNTINNLDRDNAAMADTIARLELRIAELEAEIADLKDLPEPDPETPEPEVPIIHGKPHDLAWPIDSHLSLFAHTGRREWSFGGHSVVEPFSTDEGYWHPDTSGAAYLFDRATAEYLYYEMSGDPEALATADEYFAKYVSYMGSDGFFQLKKGEKDTKYLYAKCFWLHKMLHGPYSIDSYMPLLAKMWKNVKAGYNATSNIQDKKNYTERESWVHGEFAWFYYLITGDEEARAHAIQVVRQYGNGINKVMYSVHEGGLPGGAKEDPADPYLVTSPWMSALYFQFTRCMLGKVDDEFDTLILTQAANYCDFLAQPFTGIRMGKSVTGYMGYSWGQEYHPEHTGWLAPRYLTCEHSSGRIVGDAISEEVDSMHALEILGMLHFGRYAMQRLNRNTDDVNEKIAHMERTAVYNFKRYTRAATSLPKYRLKPARFWILWLRARYELIAQ